MTPEQIAHAIADAMGSVAAEGVVPSPALVAAACRFVDGEIDLEQLRAAIRDAAADA